MTADKITTYNLTSSVIKRGPGNAELDMACITVESIAPLSLELLHTNDVKKSIQIWHKPRNIIIRCSLFKSQYKNKEACLNFLYFLLNK